jgi:hypothetical protein
MLVSNTLIKLQKTHEKKGINEKWTKMEFLTVTFECKNFGTQFFCVNLFAFFSMDSNSASNFAFYDNHIEFLKKYFFCLY